MLLAEIASASADVAATSSRLAKTARIADCLALASPDDVRIAVAYLSGELPQGPREARDRRFLKLHIGELALDMRLIFDARGFVRRAEQEVSSVGRETGAGEPVPDIVLESEQRAREIQHVLHAEGEDEIEPRLLHLARRKSVLARWIVTRYSASEY